MAKKVESTLQDIGLNKIKYASLLNNLFVRAQQQREYNRAMENSWACSRQAERI